jgi:signal transduction histidine kinase
MNYRDYPILYVDDENANRVVMKHNLGRELTLMIADSAEAALDLLARERVAVLLADQRMPRITGVDLAELVLNRYPEVVRVIITAYSDLEATIDAINRAHVNRFIKKPWTREELIAVMHESILAYHNTQLIKELQQRLVELDRVTTVAVLASSIAHDLRQPLASIEPTLLSLRDELGRTLAENLSGSSLKRRLESIRDGLDEMQVGVDRFKVISASLFKSLVSKDEKVDAVDLKQAVESAVILTRTPIVNVAMLDVELPPEPVTMLASEGKLIQLAVNLLLNAAQAIKTGTQMTNRVRVQVTGTEDQATLRVDDSGCGIGPDDLPQVFTPFFTTKGREGSGLGLAICRQIVEEMQGTIAVESIPGQGTRFTVVLPRRLPPPEEG